MVRNIRLAGGVAALGLLVALLAAQPALAGNGGNNHNNNHNNHHGFNNQWNNHHNNNFTPAFKVQGGTWQGNSGFHFNSGGWNSTPIRVQPVIYCVVIKQPNRFHDGNWHQVQCFTNAYDAQILASSLESRYMSDYGFAVRIDRRHW